MWIYVIKVFYLNSSSEHTRFRIWYIAQEHIRRSLAGRICCIASIECLLALHTILLRIRSNLSYQYISGSLQYKPADISKR